MTNRDYLNSNGQELGLGADVPVILRTATVDPASTISKVVGVLEYWQGTPKRKVKKLVRNKLNNLRRSSPTCSSAAT